jgi:hypothetical protein
VPAIRHRPGVDYSGAATVLALASSVSIPFSQQTCKYYFRKCRLNNTANKKAK